MIGFLRVERARCPMCGRELYKGEEYWKWYPEGSGYELGKFIYHPVCAKKFANTILAEV